MSCVMFCMFDVCLDFTGDQESLPKKIRNLCVYRFWLGEVKCVQDGTF